MKHHFKRDMKSLCNKEKNGPDKIQRNMYVFTFKFFVSILSKNKINA